MNPFQVLGLADNAPIGEVKKAWRKLARKHHPDMGGNEEKFKEAKDAWESIEKGYQATAKAPPVSATSCAPNPTSSFTAVAKPRIYPRAPGPNLPSTSFLRQRGKSISFVRLQISRKQAQSGCTIPYIHNGEIMNYDIRPGTSPHTREVSVPESIVIGAAFGRSSNILIQLEIV